jgi:cell division protein FtsW
MKTIRKALKDTDKVLLVFTIVMFVFGLLNIATASSSESVVRYDQQLFHYVIRQLLILIGSIIPFIYIIITPTKKYSMYAVIGYVLSLALLLYLSATGDFLKGAKAWIDVAGVRLQPSELTKPIIIVSLALIFELFRKKLVIKNNDRYKIIVFIFLIGFLVPVIVFLQKDLGTAIIISVISMSMYLVSPVLKKDKINSLIVLFFLGIAALFIILSVNGKILTDTQARRLDFFNPCSKYEDSGYQICNAFIAINDGGLFGLGLGKSRQKYSYIPEPHTDSIFAIIAEEQGFIRTTLVFLGYYFILKRIFDISAKANSERGKYMAFGVGIYISAHIILNLGGLFGVIPLTGVPLPFLSYGGTFALSLSIALAVVQRVHIETKNQYMKL